jgi:uncharacterized membrane protein
VVFEILISEERAMKRLMAIVLASSFLVAAGCNNNSSRSSGGPGATNKGGVHVTQQENSFKLSPPTLSTSIKQGEKTDVKIGITRGTGFDQDVTLHFSDVPKGVTLSPMSPVLKAGDKDVTISVEAAKDAALGDHKIKIEGKPAKEGPEATDTLKITVKQP